MAQVKFTTQRMQEVRNRLIEIIEQLQNSINTSNDLLSSISGNLQSDNIKSVLNSYVSTTSEKSSTTTNLLKELDAYLESKIGQYQTVDQTGIENLNEVQNLLNQLDI